LPLSKLSLARSPPAPGVGVAVGVTEGVGEAVGVGKITGLTVIVFDTFSFPAGEQNKTNDTCMSIVGQMYEKNYGRDSVILALGGGVVGDLAGFIASMFERGIPYIQIPTTFLAQADSSIGGKTAVDTEYGKNLVGAFKQPERVYIDVATLTTLSNKDYASGLAETIKHGVIQDAEFFRYLSENVHLMTGAMNFVVFK